jgi:energy-coupling factor transporter transmembrane protein EcfT
MIVVVLGMAYRYVFHLLGSVTDMYEARKARTVQSGTAAKSGRGFVSATGGALFGKTHAMSEEVYQAMVSRGYSGNQRTLSVTRMKALDVVWAIGCLAVAAMAVGIDRALGR